tara:strand:- start:346 stop:546 length:201 start_codon:yes stop_codon:yes gene_type:complete
MRSQKAKKGCTGKLFASGGIVQAEISLRFNAMGVNENTAIKVGCCFLGFRDEFVLTFLQTPTVLPI